MLKFFQWEKRVKFRFLIGIGLCAAVNFLLEKAGLTPIPLWCLAPIVLLYIVWVWVEEALELNRVMDEWANEVDDDDDFNLH